MMNTPSMYSVDQLLKARQNGVPDYVVVPMLQKAMAQKQAMAQQQALQQGAPKPPVAQQILDAAHNDVMQEHMARQVEEAPEPRGIDSLPSGIDESDYAGGGIIAFNGEDGSDVPEAEEDHNILGIRPIGASTGFQKFNSEADALKEGDRLLGVYGRKHKIDTLEGVVNRWAPKGDGANDPEAYAAIGHKMLGTKPGQKFNLNDATDRSKILSVISKVEHGKNYSPEDIQGATHNRDSHSTKGIASLPEAKGNIAFPAAPEDLSMPHSKEEESAAYKAQEIQDLLGEDPNAARREARLSKREADLTEEKDRSPWLALMQAGLATMAGTSPNAFANIGAGATEGLKAYGEARKDISKSSDKLMDLRDEVETAQRAEQRAIKLKGLESAEAAKAANVKAAAENELRRYTHGIKGAEYGQKERELGIKEQNIAGENEYRRGMVNAAQERAGNTGVDRPLNLRQQAVELRDLKSGYINQLNGIKKDGELSDEEKAHMVGKLTERINLISKHQAGILKGVSPNEDDLDAISEPIAGYVAPPVKEKVPWYKTTPQPTSQTSNGGFSIRPRV
jgi:hypothetical protein